MKHVPRPALLAGAFSMLVLSAFVPASADAPETNGLICQFASVVDLTAEAGTQTGQISGGPVLLTEQSLDPNLPGTTPEAGTLTCKVTVDSAATSNHILDGQKVQGHSDTGVFTAGPATFNDIVPPGTNIFLCSEFTDDSDGVTYYWDEPNGEWSTSPLVPCLLAEGSSEPSDTDKLVDSIVCPLFAILSPPEGDLVLPVVGVVWECPPYGDEFTGTRRGEGDGNGHAYAYGHSEHYPSPSPTPTPPSYYPAGTIDVSGVGPGNVTVQFSGFTPRLSEWSCSQSPDGMTVSCTPPAAPAGYGDNRCATLRAEALDNVAGAVEGDSTCTAVGAVARSAGPASSPSSDERSAHTAFPWVCGAKPAQPVAGPWHVTCVLKSAP